MEASSSSPVSQGKFQHLARMVALLVFPIQGTNGEGGGVGDNTIAWAKIGQEAAREGTMGESKNVGAAISHIVEGDLMGLIIQEDSYPVRRD